MKRFILTASAFLLLACEGPVTEEELIHHEDPVLKTPVPLSLTAGSVLVGYEAGVKDSTLVVTDAEFLVSVDAGSATWLTYVVEDHLIRVTATEENPGYSQRTAVITVIAGEGVEASSAEFSVVQEGAPRPIIRLSESELVLGNTAGATATVSVSETNQTGLSVSVASDWCKAELEGTVITLTVLADNPDTLRRSVLVTVGSAKLSVDLTAIQEAAWPPSKVGTAYGTEGVFFWRSKTDPKEYLVVSAKAEKRQWGPAVVLNSPLGNVNTSTLSGPEAANRIRAAVDYTTASYALQFCDEMGEGWYLPTRDEGDALFLAYDGETFFAKDKSGTATQKVPNECTEKEKAARTAFDALLTSLPGGVALNPADWSGNGDSIWICMETSAGLGYYYRYGAPSYNAGTKTSTSRWARCVKKVTVK